MDSQAEGPVAESIDERDFDWDLPAAEFCVFFFSGASDDMPSAGHVETFLLRDCTTSEALSWARTHRSASATFALALVDRDRRPGRAGLRWLFGYDRNTAPTDAVAQRLLEWRDELPDGW